MLRMSVGSNFGSTDDTNAMRNVPDLPASRQSGGLLRTHRLMKRGARFGQKEPPGLGQRDLVAVAFQQPHVQFFFQRLDLHAQRRLHDAQPLRGPAEMQFLGKRHERAQMLQFHDCLPSCPGGSSSVITNHDNNVTKDYWRDCSSWSELRTFGDNPDAHRMRLKK